jgi:PQQ-dependent dehydrogenase (methanol/ethanol family)
MHLTLRRAAAVGMAAALALTASANAAGTRQVSGQRAAAGANMDWAQFGNTSDNTRYSTLTQITTANVHKMGVAWTMQQGPGLSGWETDPVVVNGIMYFTTSVDQVRAVNAVTGRQLWQFTPKVDFYRAIAGGGGGAPASRGVAVANGKVFLLTFDNQLIALQASTGEKLWDSSVANPNLGYSESSPATYWKGLLFVGSEEGDAGERGFVAAYNANTGKQVWRFYTVPAAGHGWIPKQGNHGGGDVWMPDVIDNKTGILYFGTGNPSPDVDNSQRPGCNQWADATVALNARTGKFIWGHTEVCNDQWDYDSHQEPIIFDMQYHGKTVHAVGHGNKSGLYFVYDAATGKVLSKSPYLTPYTMPHPKPTAKGVQVCPGALGGLEYSPPAFSPAIQAVYLPGLNECALYQLAPTADTNRHRTGLPDFGGVFTINTKLTGFMAAVDVATGKVLWKDQFKQPLIGGALATAGGLVFSGADDGHFYALDAKTGKILWSPNVGLGTGAAPITYMVNGVQYVAIALGSSFGATPAGGTMAVFKLNGSAVKPLPAVTTVGGVAAEAHPNLKGLIKVNPWMYTSAERQYVAIVVTAGATSDNNGFNFDGYSHGKGNFIIPAGWQVDWIFTNKAALPHSVGLSTTISLPPKVVQTVLGPVETPNALAGVRSGVTQYVGFQAVHVGTFYMVCLVPGHLQAGMWDKFTVSNSAHLPSFVTQ